MKYIIILGDGMADEPMALLGDKTPLQAANKPAIDKVASLGRNGLLDTIPAGFTPGSEIANLSVLGYDVPTVYEGRGALEAASIGLELKPSEMAMRCNLITIENGNIKNHSAGHISNEEAKELILFLQQQLGNDIISFHQGVSYRHVVKMKGGNKNINCTPPHDVLGNEFTKELIKPENDEASQTADYLNNLILRSQTLLVNHPVNIKRAKEGKEIANSIWLWSPGYKPNMKTLSEIYPIKSGAVISAVDLIKGIGVYAGLEVIEVEGATGLYDTNYEGKAQAALEALKKNDFVYLHIEASDEAGHEGDAILKVRTIEDLDSRIVKPIFNEISTWNEPITLAILPDHPTPCGIRTHTDTPVPFIIYRTGEEADEIQAYDEFFAKEGSYGLLRGNEFMREFITPLTP